MHAIANRTEGLNPAHKYVPWIVVDGVHTEEVSPKMQTNAKTHKVQVEQKAMADLAGLVCSLYKGAKPVQCKTLSSLSNIFIEKD